MMKKANLVIIPFHDLRKCQTEGFRTRDCHLIEHLSLHPEIAKILVVNRPTTYVESVYKKVGWKTSGKIIDDHFRYKVTEFFTNCYSIDFMSYDIFMNILKGRSWFFRAYGISAFRQIVIKILKDLGFNDYSCINFTLYSVKLLLQLEPTITIFDALDNWLKIPTYNGIKNSLFESYKKLACIADVWTTNSDQNKIFFSENFDIGQCHVIKNGVDIERFTKKLSIPDDLLDVKKPVIGIAAKITHLIDTCLLNDIVENTHNCSFVLIGQILNKKIFKRLSKKIIYLGDKHYDIYPNYVNNFDICFIPYVVGEKEHGGDSIKIYEFLAAGKPVITTNFSGIEVFKESVFIIHKMQDFCTIIDKILGLTSINIPKYLNQMTWRMRTEKFIDLIQESYALKNSS